MTDESEGSRVHRHADAADCPEGLPEDEAAAHPPPVRRHAGGHTRCWIEGGEVRSRDVAADGTPEALPGAVPAEFGPLPPRLAADPGPGVPDPGGGGRALRDASPGGGAAAPRLLLERLDARPCRRRSARPAGRRRPGTGRRKAWLTRLGRVEAERSRFRCRSCGGGCFPPDRALGLEGDTVTPGTASVIAGTVPLMGFEAAQRFEREEVLDGRPPEPRMQLSVDGAGVPMRREEVAGVRGQAGRRHLEDQGSEARGGVHRRGPGPRDRRGGEDRGGESVTCLTGGAAAPSGGREASDFAARPDREARRRGLHDAGGPVVVSDGADWIPNACEGPFGGRKAAFVPGLLHCPERASDAARRSCRPGAERDRRFAEARRTSGRAGRRRRAGSWHPSGTGTGKRRPAAGISRAGSAGCGTTRSASGASGPEAASWRADAGGSAADGALRNAPGGEGRQRHAGAEGLRHEPPAARLPGMAGESGRRRMMSKNWDAPPVPSGS